jgi:DNA (cytosine-5)-methyltransferase 1
VTPEEQLERLLEAGRKYRAFKYWDRIRVGCCEMPLTGQGFNAIKFDPQKPAHTIRRNDGNLGTSGAMHWAERRRFSLPEFKRFASFPDDFEFAGSFDEGIR